jgi:hypothetical protein
MDGTRFDNLIKWLGSTRLTRLRALQGLAAATVVTLTGVSRAPERTAAARRRRTICHCGDNNPEQIGCVTKRLSRRRARRHLRRHENDYKGKCNKTPKPPAECGGKCKAGKEICCPPGSSLAGQCRPNIDACALPVECGGLCTSTEVCCPPGSKQAGTCKPNSNACSL